jgi:hypothetical protein
LSRGRGNRQDRRDHQDYPTKHAHRNLVQTCTIERRRLRRGSRPTASHLIPPKSRCRQPAGIRSFRQRSFQNIQDLLTGAQRDTVLRACRNAVDTPLQKVRWFEGNELFDSDFTVRSEWMNTQNGISARFGPTIHASLFCNLRQVFHPHQPILAGECQRLVCTLRLGHTEDAMVASIVDFYTSTVFNC